MTTRYLTTDQNGNGDQTYWDINGYFLHGPSGEKLNLGGGNTTVTASNEIVQIGTSYIRIPQGVSNERPDISNSYIGMMRYLTTENLLEYFNGQTNTWIPISLPNPTLTSITPQYINYDASGGETNTNTYTLTGSNFNNVAGGISVEVIGNNGAGTILLPDSNSASSETSATFTFDPSGTEQLIGISNELNFAVKLTNTNSGFSSILNNAIIATNAGPQFTQPSVFTSSSFDTFAVQDPCANFIVGGIDLSSPPHPPLDFTFVSGSAGGFNTGGVNDISSISDFSSIVQVPSGNRLSEIASSYNFKMRVTDASLATSDANYTLSLANPVVTSISPNVVDVSDLPIDISVNGNYFIRDSGVQFSEQTTGISAEQTDVSYISINSLVVKDVSGAVGTYDISINNGSVYVNVPTLTLRIIVPTITITDPGSTTTSYKFSSGFSYDFTTVGAYTITTNFDASANTYLKGGGGGGGNQAASQGGGGGNTVGLLQLTYGTTYQLLVGGGGSFMPASSSSGPPVTGGGGIVGSQGYGGQGGGYTGLFETSVAFANSLLIAGGGGGGAWEVDSYTATTGSQTWGRNGGNGGGTVGIQGGGINTSTGGVNTGTGGNTGGGGGTQSAGGSASNATGSTAGSPLTGGSPATSGDNGGGGGGGGGYYGGGGGAGTNPGSAGGGGSGYVNTSVVSSGTIENGLISAGAGANGSAGSAKIFFGLNSAVSLTYSSGASLPTPTDVNGNYVYTFSAPTNTTTTYAFTINSAAYITYLCVAGGGGGGYNGGGGGGAGGMLNGIITPTGSTTITVVVGKGGAGSPGSTNSQNGDNSTISGTGFSTITSNGGGNGGGNDYGTYPAGSGGSGGGGGSSSGGTTGVGGGTSGGASQGYPGGYGSHTSGWMLGGGGGGGAGHTGFNCVATTSPTPAVGANGGAGRVSYITGSAVTYAGGGGGAVNDNTSSSGPSSGGAGGGGQGGFTGAPTAGTDGLGGGGGGGDHPPSVSGARGGSGVVILRIPKYW